MRASAIFVFGKEQIEKMGKYDYNENVGTQHVRLVTKGDTMANKKVKVYTYKRVSTSMQVDGYSLLLMLLIRKSWSFHPSSHRGLYRG